MSTMSRQTAVHLNKIQQRNSNGQRQKKKRRSNRRMWLDAEQSFREAKDSMSITGEVRALISHPDLRENLSEERLNAVAEKAMEIANAAKERISALSELRKRHIALRAKWPKTQRHHHSMDELIDNMTVQEGYSQWTEETMKCVILPCAEITEQVEGIIADAEPESETPAEADSNE